MGAVMMILNKIDRFLYDRFKIDKTICLRKTTDKRGIEWKDNYNNGR